jgi:hypothetical protein
MHWRLFRFLILKLDLLWLGRLAEMMSFGIDHSMEVYNREIGALDVLKQLFRSCWNDFE